MKKLSIAIVVAFLLMSCTSRKNEKLTESSYKEADTKIIDDSGSLLAAKIYQGVLPCADCSGIKTILKIYDGYGTMESHKFELITVYQGKGNGKEFKETGNFNYERGVEKDPDGTIYVLNWDQPELKQIYYGRLSNDPNKIYLLNNKREIIKSDLNYFLTLQK